MRLHISVASRRRRLTQPVNVILSFPQSAFPTDVMLAPPLKNSSASLITPCKPCPPTQKKKCPGYCSGTSGNKGQSDRCDLAWACCKVIPHHHLTRTKPLCGDRELVYLCRHQELAQILISSAASALQKLDAALS